jgi:ATP-dependent DNA helicase RecG
MHKPTLCKLLDQLLALAKESEWLEFKHNNEEPRAIGEYISALSNSAVAQQQPKYILGWRLIR